MAARPMVVVLLGTDHHPFPRLVGWACQLAGAGPAEWFVQHGATALPASASSNLTGAPILPAADLRRLLERADAVVTHGGPGLIMEARDAGHRPIVVPRDPGLGEHVDDHQQRFARHISLGGLATCVTTLLELEVAVAGALLAGRDAAGPRSGGGSAARFGVLVDELLHRT